MEVTRNQGRLAGKVALVTGAGRGIGRAIALGLAAEGAAVAIGDLNGESAEGVASQIVTAGGRLDVTDEASIGELVARAEAELGPVGVLVSNAGLRTDAPFLELSRADWELVIGVNLTGTFLIGQAVARRMVANGIAGSIVNLSSTNAEVASRNRTHYVASKGGVRMLTKNMAAELGQYGIRVNAIGPGPTRTEGVAHRHDNPELTKPWLDRVALTRLGRPEDMVGAVVFLASDEAGWVTGTTLYVDGGFLAK
ncbi:MAG: SDR family oxidoreductase [Chloroflexi bacterium]|nr:SDR family oxidoreductase [Chloroflexota bacterium]